MGEGLFLLALLICPDPTLPSSEDQQPPRPARVFPLSELRKGAGQSLVLSVLAGNLLTTRKRAFRRKTGLWGKITPKTRGKAWAESLVGF